MRFRTGASLIVVALTACAEHVDREPKPIDYVATAVEIAEVFCDPATSCKCQNTVVETRQDCVDALAPVIAGVLSNPFTAPQYNEECLPRLDKAITERGCMRPDDLDRAAQQSAYDARSCKLLSGVGEKGESCRKYGRYQRDFRDHRSNGADPAPLGDSCAQGLECVGEVGLETCAQLPAETSDVCARFLGCPPGTACIDQDFDGVSRCEKPRKEGDRCNPHDGAAACADSWFCDEGTLQCTARLGEGEPCDAVHEPCAIGFVCHVEGQCVPWRPATCEFDWECDWTELCGPDHECVAAPIACTLPRAVTLCQYADDGICDEPPGTGRCLEGTDATDCD